MVVEVRTVDIVSWGTLLFLCRNLCYVKWTRLKDRQDALQRCLAMSLWYKPSSIRFSNTGMDEADHLNFLVAFHIVSSLSDKFMI